MYTQVGANSLNLIYYEKATLIDFRYQFAKKNQRININQKSQHIRNYFQIKLMKIK